MKITTKLGAIALIAFALVVFLNGCKKTDRPSEKPTDDGIEQLRQQYKSLPLTSTQILNLPGKGYYSDINGNKIPSSGLLNKSTASSCPGPGASEFSQDFFSMETEYTCGVGYRFVVRYKIVSEFYPVLSLSSTVFSSGRIKLKNSSGTYYYTTTTANRAPVFDVQNNGVVGFNGVGDDMNEFIVSYRTEYITVSQYNDAVAVEPSAFIYTDCPAYTLTIGFSSQQYSAGSLQISLPCTRVDRMIFNPRNGNTPPNIAGADPTGMSTCYPSGYVFPNRQEIYFKNGSGVWKKFYLYTNGLTQASTETYLFTILDIWYVDVSTSQSANGLVPGNVQVRYRNNHMGSNSNGGPCVTQPTDTWVYATWYIN